ncbi:MAG: hypothetical protein LC117_04800 [Bacteroidia bacterium]|nr:hypothetical protein [Bacteroidia bacterium]MCZ2277228.1 hypothetical protein [Bacteroidia bacterium]
MKQLLFLLTLVPMIHLNSCSQSRQTGQVGSKSILIEINTESAVLFYADYSGFNTANLFTTFDAEDSQFSEALKTLNPDLFRFPGGTIANFYHPDKPGYGFNPNDINKLKESAIAEHMGNISAKRQVTNKNYLDDFIRMAKLTHASVLYVVNILSARPDQIINILSRFESEGINIKGIELGNEYYLKAYRDIFPDAQSYIHKAIPFAKSIRKEFPRIKLSVPVQLKAGTGKGFPASWNRALAAENFYDAISVHSYPSFDKCSDDTEAELTCYTNQINTFIDSEFPAQIRQLMNQFDNHEIWLTEWNINRPNLTFGNSFAHCLFTSAFLFKCMELQQSSQKIPLMTFHNLASNESAYSLISGETSNFSLTANYYLFRMLAGSVTGKLKWNPVSVGLSDNRLKVLSYTSGNQTYLVIINFSGSSFTDVKLTVNSQNVTVEHNSMLSYSAQHASKFKSDITYDESESWNNHIKPYSIRLLRIRY